MSDQIVKVARKGQVTIPIEQRRKYGIKEGMNILVRNNPEGVLLTPVPNLEDLVGIDAGTMSIGEMKRRLDKMRSEDRY